ncbi:DNA helicase UvrD [candidate division WWE3 bacterium]|nr:DNA helicase UvrD [candidate division WWE3 bacterium]
MQRIIDLHQHSHYSRATGKEATVEGMYKWSKIKGIDIIGTGDFTHPQWFAELKEKLQPAESGLFKLRDDIASRIDLEVHESCRNRDIRFILTVEISTIYSKNGKVRKIHQCIVVPSFEAASDIIAQLGQIGNLKADGRPILGLDSKRLLEITIKSNPDNLFFPAHIWTPWFGLFGSKSGFDSLEEAFEELTPDIKAYETGLSSDPRMNYRLSQLDGLTILSNSDAHSPQKLGREATIIDSDLSYEDIIDAIKTNDHRIVGTIEFFPEEGKYHYDGHRACLVRFSPEETKKHQGLCPKCHKPLVVGVENRIDELADRPADYMPDQPKKVQYIIPLPEILAEINKTRSTTSRKVLEHYDQVNKLFGNEFDVLRTVPLNVFNEHGFTTLAEAMDRLRRQDVILEPGYDGVYGVIKVFGESTKDIKNPPQLSLF